MTAKMVAKKCHKSEYRRQYRPVWDSFAQTYVDHVDYRQHRRQLEHHHQEDVFTWEDWDLNSLESDSGSEDATPRPKSVPIHKYKHELYTRLHKERQQQYEEQLKQQRLQMEKLRIEAEDELKKKSHKKRRSKSKSPPQIVSKSEDAVDSTVNANTVHTAPEEIESSNKVNGISQQKVTSIGSKPKRPHRSHLNKTYKKLPKPRPMSAPTSKAPKLRPTSTSPRQSPEKPPFMPYGCCDAERETGIQKTHNIRASTDIYPAALRAQKRKENQIKMKEQSLKKAPHYQLRKIALFNEKMKRDTAQWDTEYRQRYAGYDDQEYKKNITTRSPSTLGAFSGTM